MPTSDERSTHSLLDEQTWVVLRVQDDGCGIPSESRHRIFEPFFTTREVGAGRGMGLSVVHGIVEEHGGAILVDSEPGEGSTFSVFLPVCQAPARHERNEVRDAERASARILLVDDEVTLVRLMSSMLESAGHHVTAFVNPHDALTAFFESPSNFDVVITDQSMPVVSGDALIASIRAAGHDLPVILATGSLPQLTPERLEELGVSVSISKPTTLRELREAVDDALDAARRARVPTGGVR